MINRFVFACAVALVVGCSTPPPVSPPVVEEPAPLALERPSIPDPAGAVIPGRALSALQIQRVLWLLDRAELAVKERRLTSPEGSSAWAYYREVLGLIPAHQEATDGLRKIADSYIDWSYAALRQDQYGAARTYLGRATMVEPRHPDLAALRAAVPKWQPPPKPKPKPRPAPKVAVEKPSEPPAVAPAAPVVVVPVEDAARSDFDVDRRQLKVRSPELQAKLAGYADLIEARNSRVTIEAPTDADGRWLYQRLNERREEYRVRANFKVSKQPRIRLLD